VAGDETSNRLKGEISGLGIGTIAPGQD